MAYNLPPFQYPTYFRTVLMMQSGLQVQMSHCSICKAAMQTADEAMHTQWHQTKHNETSGMLGAIYADLHTLTNSLRTAEAEINALKQQNTAKASPARKRRGTPAAGHTATKNDPLHERRLGTLADSGDTFVRSPASGRKLSVQFDCPKCSARIDRLNPYHRCDLMSMSDSFCQECEQTVEFDAYRYVYGNRPQDNDNVVWQGHKKCVLPLTSACDHYEPRPWGDQPDVCCANCGWPKEDH